MTINKATKLRIPNRLLRDKTLSLKAKGLLAVMLDLPEDFYMTIDTLTRAGRCWLCRPGVGTEGLSGTKQVAGQAAVFPDQIHDQTVTAEA